MKEMVQKIFMNQGLAAQDAQVMADIMVEADLRGVHSHGIARLPIIVERIRKGLINVRPKLQLIRENDAVFVLDADNGLGPVAGVKAMRLAIEKARKFGIAMGVVRRTNNIGICAYYAIMGAQNDQIGIVGSNAAKSMAPFGGAERVIGTNPIAIAVPAKRYNPIVLDMATSIVAYGKIQLAKKEGKKIPAEWALDEEGKPTTDPEKALRGSVRPIGGYKGYGLAIIIEILAGVLSGSAILKEVGNIFELDRVQGLGNFFISIDVGHFTDSEKFKARIDELIETIKSSRKAPGFAEILLPGELEWRTREENVENGVPVPTKVFQELQSLLREDDV